eukprot:GHRR01022022.1.p1 GENE.GHRR01022022.1~~GHRR01022022.1.p1  ORF type:complete len:356 (+),score=153.42 GHRR01022022.1:854-1921(+)
MQVCYHCLKVLPSLQRQQQASAAVSAPICTKHHVFCSSACLDAAKAAYHTLEQQLDLTQLDRYCSANSERFPLLTARLALMLAQQGTIAQPSRGTLSQPSSIDRISSSSRRSLHSRSLNSSSWLSNISRADCSRWASLSAINLTHSAIPASTTTGVSTSSSEDINTSLSFLCYANVPLPPPTPWETAHKLLVDALRSAAGVCEEQQQAAQLAAALKDVHLDWYVAVMARLHINTFKVDAVMAIDWDGGMAAAAAAMLQQGGSSSGSALYLLASMYNHSCEPNVNVTFPGSNSTAVFTAARPISGGEQLFISYIDADQEVGMRQEYLAFVYGFRCRCVRCKEELAEAAKHMPPQLH